MNSVGWGIIFGAATGAVGYGAGKAIGRLAEWWSDPEYSTPGGRTLSVHAYEEKMIPLRISPENVDEVIDTGQAYYDPLRDSTVYAKPTSGLTTPVE